MLARQHRRRGGELQWAPHVEGEIGAARAVVAVEPEMPVADERQAQAHQEGDERKSGDAAVEKRNHYSVDFIGQSYPTSSGG